MIFAAAATVFASCAKEIEGVEPQEKESMSFTAFVDEAASTKTSLTSTYDVVWNSSDAISVFANEENTKFSATNLQDDGKTATFVGLAAHADTYYAVYPYAETASMSGNKVTMTLPSSQKPVAGSFDPAANISAAKSSGSDLYFRNAGAIVGFSVNGEGITSVTLSSKEGDVKMSGKVTLDLSGETPVLDASEGATYVSMAGPFEAGAKYYFVVAPGTYKGLTLTFENAAKEADCVKTTDAEVVIDRNGNKWLGEFTISDGDWNVTEYLSPVLNGKAEVEAFCNNISGDKITVMDLTVKGRDVTTAELQLLNGKIGEIRGTLTLDGVGSESTGDWLDTNNLIEHADILGSIVLRNIMNIVNPSGFKKFTKINGDLIIENCPNFVLNWGVGSGLDAVEEIVGNLEINGQNKMDGNSFYSLKKVGGNVLINGIVSTWQLEKGMQIQSIGGDLTITNNEVLWSLEGFEKLTYIGGNVVIFDNHTKMPRTNTNVDGHDCIGLCLIKDYKDSGVISPTATIKLGWTGNEVKVDELSSCTPDGPKSYYIRSQAELVAFIEGKSDEKETVKDLYITGADIEEGTFRSIDDRVAAIVGTLTMENISEEGKWISTDQVMENIDLSKASIVVRDMPSFVNPGGWANLTSVEGDIIIENCPGFQYRDGWMPFKNLTNVGGSIKVSGLKGFSSGDWFNKIEKIGGDFIMKDIPDSFWDFKSQTLREIGGDLTITGCPRFENFLGFHQLTKLGGNVTVIKPAGGGDWLPETDYNDNKVGLCIFKGYKESGVMRQDAVITAIGRAGVNNDWVYHVDNLAPCGPSFN